MNKPEYTLIEDWTDPRPPEHLLPRLNAVGGRRTYHNRVDSFTPLLRCTAEDTLNRKFALTMWNSYGTTGDGIGAHHDWGHGGIAVISIGSAAMFTFESCKKSSNQYAVKLPAGSLLYFPESTNRWFAHSVVNEWKRWSLVLREQATEHWWDINCRHGG